ncbi:hypothetical protein D9M73_176580 [compost metagenome]
MISVHALPADDTWPRGLCIKREHLGSGQQQEIVTFEQIVQGAIPLAATDRGLIDIRRRQAQATLDFPLGLGLELLACVRIGIQATEAALHQPVTVHQPGLPQALHGKIRLAGLDLATQGRKVLQRRLAQAHHARIHRQVAVVVAQPAHAHLAKILRQRLMENLRVLSQRQGHARVVPGLGAK